MRRSASDAAASAPARRASASRRTRSWAPASPASRSRRVRSSASRASHAVMASDSSGPASSPASPPRGSSAVRAGPTAPPPAWPRARRGRGPARPRGGRPANACHAASRAPPRATGRRRAPPPRPGAARGRRGDSAARARSSAARAVATADSAAAELALGLVGLATERRGLARQALGLGPGLERRVAAPDADRERVQDRAAVAGHEQPAERQHRLQRARPRPGRDPHRTVEQRPRRARVVAPDRRPGAVRRRPRRRPPRAGAAPPACRRPAPGPRRRSARGPRAGPARRRGPPRPPGRRRRPAPARPARPRPRAAAPGSTPSSSSTRRPPTLRAARAMPRASSSASRCSSVASRPVAAASALPARRRALAGGAPLAVGRVRGQARPPRVPRPPLPPPPCGGERGPRPAPSAASSSATRVADASARASSSRGSALESRRPAGARSRPRPARAASARRTAASSSPRAAARGAERTQLRQALGERPIGVGERRLEREIGLRDGLGEPPAVGLEIRLRGRALAGDPRPVARGGLELADRARLAQAERGALGAADLVCRPPLGLELGARRHRRRDLGDLGLRRSSAASARPLSARSASRAALGVRGAGRRLVPAGVRGDDERGRQLLAGRQPRRLLLGELPQPTRLRPQLGEDVLDPGQVALGLGQLLLGLAPPPLVPPDAGDLLEQRPALLRPQRQRLVDHALADEQERVLGEVRAVEQVDEVAQPHALAIEEVVVLARPVEAPPELDDAVLDRQQRVAVVEHDRDVGHPLGRALLRARPDDVLGAPDPERSPLLAQRPAERVGEVGLARSVGPDDGADARAELDQRALGERLEPLDAQPEQPGRGGHEPSPVAASDASSPPQSSRVRVAIGRGPSAASGAPPSRARRRPLPPEHVERLGGRRRLGDPPRRALPDAERPRRRPRPRSGTASRGRARPPRPAGRRAARPVVRWVCSWSRLLGLLSVVIAWSAVSSSAASSWIQSRAASQPRSR